MTTKQTTEHKNMAWLDLETTGITPRSNLILEIGIIITTPQLEVVAERNWVIKYLLVNQTINLMNDYVRNMHEVNGLINEMSVVEEDDLLGTGPEEEAIEFVKKHGAENSPLCGNTIGFDRSFLKYHAPQLNDVFHYLSIDVSTLKNVLRLHYPEQEPWQPPENKAHRALDDLRCSIEEYKYYLDIFSKGAQHVR